MNYNECVEYILSIPKFNKIKSNENCGKILEKLGNPQDKLKVFHIAGTNGKGSTSAFISSILQKMGKQVGLFTSPHLVKINERIKVNNQDISDQDFLNTALQIKEIIYSLFEDEYVPTFFEYIFLIAVTYFAKKNVEYAIFEVGLGGRLDTTNIFEKPLVSVITSVSMDHMEILGNTIEEIAAEKAGIIKRDVPVVYFGDNEKVAKIIEEKAGSINTRTIKVLSKDISILGKSNKAIDFSVYNMYDKYGCLTVPFVMEYQTINATLAIKAIECGLTSEKIDTLAVKEGIKNTVWPGRMEQVRENIYLDGAHNYEGVEQFVKYANEVSKEKDIYIIFSVVKEKEYHLMMDLISTIKNCKGYFVAPINNSRAVVATDLAEYLRKHVDSFVSSFDSLKAAYDYAMQMKKTEDVLFFVGSLYMVGEAKKLFEA